MAGLITRNRWRIALVVLFVAGWTVLYFLVSPDEMVRTLGIENSYLLLVALSIVGAFLSMTTFTSYPAVVGFAAGGMSIWVIGLLSAIGLTIGDALFYYLVGEVRELLRGRAKEKAVRLGEWLDERPGWVIPVVTYIWVGMLPLANNILTGALAVTGYPFRRILVPVFLGNATFPMVVAYLTSIGSELLG
jgi:membrane protein YqaA with SNARE-associated domain